MDRCWAGAGQKRLVPKLSTDDVWLVESAPLLQWSHCGRDFLHAVNVLVCIYECNP
jgi:hypothetical protein